MKTPGRGLAVAAVGFLLLDAILLAYGGFWFHRWALVAGAAVCLAAAGFVVWWWRRYLVALRGVADARREARTEVEAIRDLLRRHHIDN